MPTERHRLICAIATPLRDDFSIHRELLLAHGRDLLARGCDGLAVFGTSGEGPSLALADRCAALDYLLDAGLAPEQLIVGVGSASLADVVALTRHAVAAGVPETLLMPAFFLRAAATEEGEGRVGEHGGSPQWK
jgi:4-hydroxy-tetrahydrodipicolinate synthase